MYRCVLSGIFVLALAACSSTPTTSSEDSTKNGIVTGELGDSSTGLLPPVDRAEIIPLAKQQAIGLAPQSLGVRGGGSVAAGSVMVGDCHKGVTSILFDFDSYIVRDSYQSTLIQQAKCFTGGRNVHVVIQGHTDERGSREYNLALGQRRAEVVKKQLVLLGVDESRVEAVSFGEERPKSGTKSEDAYVQNRRVDIVYGE